MTERLKDIGEFEFIRRIARMRKAGPSVFKGIGDDCAVLRYTKDKYMLFTSDMIIEDVHFRRGAPPESIGHKALAVNISDIAACGGIPRWAEVSVGLPAGVAYDFARRLYKGIYGLARRFKLDIVGGDTNLSKKIIISVALTGEVEKDRLALRSGAEEKDAIVLSGRLQERPDDLTFLPRLKEARYLVENFNLTSMIDISDGFLSDLKHILAESEKSAIVYESLIPPKAAGSSLSRILNQGEQFELIFTMPPAQLKKLPKIFYPVGEIIKGSQDIILIRADGRRKIAEPKGFRHF